MTIIRPKHIKGPYLDLTLPASSDPMEVVLRNATTGKQLILALPESWDGDDLSLDFQGRRITDQDGVDRSSLLVGSDLWIAEPLVEGLNDLKIEVNGGPVVVTEDFDQSAGALNGQGVGGLAQVSGPRSPGTLADDATMGTVAWANLSNAGASDDSYATANLVGATSHYLKATGFGFAIPAGASIDGIVAEVERRIDSGSALDNAVRIVKGGAIQATDRSAGGRWPAVDTYQTYGSPTDLWGATWAYTDLNASDFGIALSVRRGLDGGPTYIDHIRITVHYTTASGERWATTGDASDFAVEDTGHTAQRTATSDSAGIENGRLAVPGTTDRRGSSSEVEFTWSAVQPGLTSGVLLRYVDARNFAAGYVTSDGLLRIVERVAGVTTVLAEESVSVPIAASPYAIRGDAFEDGRVRVDYGPVGNVSLDVASAESAELASGGDLEEGKVGYFDHHSGAGAVTRNYDGYRARDLSGAYDARATLRWHRGYV